MGTRERERERDVPGFNLFGAVVCVRSLGFRVRIHVCVREREEKGGREREREREMCPAATSLLLSACGFQHNRPGCMTKADTERIRKRAGEGGTERKRERERERGRKMHPALPRFERRGVGGSNCDFAHAPKWEGTQ